MAEEDRPGEGFLSRWSRLKRSGGEAGPGPSPAAAAPPAAPPAQQPEAEPGMAAPEAEPEIDPESLPPVESLTAESDISLFLRRGVPAALRNAALRRAWSLDPTIRDFIGPADYAWDWNVPGGAPGYVAQIATGPDVEALADRILGLVRERASDAPTTGADREAEPPGPAASSPTPETAPGSAIRLSDAVGEAPPAAVEAPPPAAAPQPDDTVAPAGRGRPMRPRHGGAVPT